MPLPAILLARLQKRGIIHKSEDGTKGENKENLKDDEEVIAESYDDTERKHTEETNESLKQYIGNGDSRIDVEDLKAHIEAKFKGYPGCPNKYNKFHECTLFCKEYWNDGHSKPKKRYVMLRKKMLEKYPLPINWTEVYDPGTGRYYYWNQDTDMVSWLSPTHPRAQLTRPVAKIREDQYMEEKNIPRTDQDADSSDSDDSEESNDEEQNRKRYAYDNRAVSDIDDYVQNKQKNKEERRVRYAEERRVVKINDIDPMDPAAYSDIPRGGWGEGLYTKLEAKTGADTTAPGPLYQMRPYPSPGAVLRANAKYKSDEN